MAMILPSEETTRVVEGICSNNYFTIGLRIVGGKNDSKLIDCHGSGFFQSQKQKQIILVIFLKKPDRVQWSCVCRVLYTTYGSVPYRMIFRSIFLFQFLARIQNYRVRSAMIVALTSGRALFGRQQNQLRASFSNGDSEVLKV